MIYKKVINLTDSNPHINEGGLKQSVRQLNYILEFAGSSSVFYLEEQMSNDADPYSSMAKRMVGTGTFYKDIGDNFTLQQLAMFNQEFLVKLQEPEFIISQETGNIGNYEVIKATAKETIKAPNSDLEDLVNTITVWFAPDIPIPFGPVKYNGLPGLILKIAVNNVTFQATEIKLYDKREKEIKRPDGKTVLTEGEFNKRLREIVENL